MLYATKERHGLESLRGVKVDRRVEQDGDDQKEKEKAKAEGKQTWSSSIPRQAADHSTDDQESGEPWARVGEWRCTM